MESHREDDVFYEKDKEGQQVFLNSGTLKLIFVVDSREHNRVLLASLFEHMSKWFEENAQYLADSPEMDGSSYRLHEEIIDRSTDTSMELPEIEELGDTFPEDWLGGA